MCYLGADGQTKSQMKSKLYGSGPEDDDVKAWSRKILKFAGEKGEEYKLRFADRIYLNEKFRLKDNYVDSMGKVFNASVLNGNFETDAARITQEINSWVEKVTENKIKNLVAPDVLDARTVMLLVNALYFKGVWEDKFYERSTKKQDFYVSENRKVQVDMMRLREDKGYYEDQEVQVLELGYLGSQVSMTIILPKVKNGLKNVLQGMDGRKLSTLVESVSFETVIIELPKFKMENSFNLNNALMKLGISEAFTDDANFSKMTATSVKISEVVHKSFIKIDENGTEAAAATYVKVVPASARFPPPTPKKFTADHPFLLLLTVGGRNDKEILFIGEFYGTRN
uniref:Serpin domain-containing protein n=1 Tax=Romanomermis culicivorax TaxID=13658 RepID=A0A915JNN0_ROMCU